MSDPLAGYTPDWRQRMRQQETGQGEDPLAGYTSDWRDRINKTGVNDQRLLTASGRATIESENLQENTAKLQELLKRPDLQPAQRARIEGMIKQYDQPAIGGRTTEYRDPRENLLRGIASGIPEAITGVADLVAGAANAVLPGQPLQGVRDWAKESNAAIEETFDPQGLAGTAGNFVGQIVGGAGPYGLMTRGTAAGLLKILPEASKLAGMIRAAEAGSLGQRLVGQGLLSLPVDAVQAATMEDATVQDKVKQFLINTGANALFATIPGRKQPELKPRDPGEVKLDVEKAASLEGTPASTTTQAEIEAMMKQEAAIRAERELQKQAKAAWKEANPEASWKKLTQEERTKIFEGFKATKQTAPVVTPEGAAVPPVEVPAETKIKVPAEAAPLPKEITHESDVGNLPEVVKSLEQMSSEAAAAVEATKGIGSETRISGNLEPDSNLNKVVRHGTDPEQAVGIINSGLRQGSSVDAGTGLAEGYTVMMEFGPTETTPYAPGDISSEGSFTTNKLTKDIRRIFFDANAYTDPTDAKEAYARIRTALDKSGRQNVPIEAMNFNDAKDTWEYGGEVTFPEKSYASMSDSDLDRKATNLLAIEKPTPEQSAKLEANMAELGRRGLIPTDAEINAPHKPSTELTAENATPYELWRAVDLLSKTVPRGNKVAFVKAHQEISRLNVELTKAKELYANGHRFDLNQSEVAPKAETPKAPVKVSETLPDAPVRPDVATMNMEQLNTHVDKLNDLLDKATDPAAQGLLQDEIMQAAKAKRALMKESQAVAAQQSAADLAGAQAVLEANVAAKNLSHLRDKLAITDDPEIAAQIQQEIDVLEAQRIHTLNNGKAAGAKIVDGEQATVTPSKPPAPPKVDLATIPEETRQSWFRLEPREMQPAVLVAHAEDLMARIQSLPKAEQEPYIKRFMALREEYTRRTRPARTSGFITTNIPPEVGGGVLGYMIGSTVGDTDEERQRNAYYGLMLGVGGGYAVRKIHFKYETKGSAAKFSGHDEMNKYVRTAAQLEGENKFQPFLTRMQAWYQDHVRPVFAIEKATEKAGGKSLPAQLNPGKLAATFGRWVSQSESFFFGNPSIEGPDGNMVHIADVQNVVEIANMVDGDTETLGNLMAAMTTLEQASKGKTNSPIPVQLAARYASAVPQKYHDAAKAARRLNLALIDVLVSSGVISPEARLEMAKEAWYAPLERVFGKNPMPKNAPAPVGSQQGSGLGAASGVKARGKGQAPYVIANPFETMVANIPRMLRAAERNRAKIALVKLYEANKPAFEGLMYPAPRSPGANSPAFDAQVAALKGELHLSHENAMSMASAFGDAHLDPTSNTMSVWNNGALQTYRLDPYIADAYRSLHPAEMDVLWNILGIPADIARKGIVNNPVFIGYQAFRDNWQMTLNSQYGFRFGVDWLKGMKAGYENSPEYKLYKSGGAGSIYGRQAVADPQRALESVRTKGIAAEGSAFGVAWNQVKSMSFGEAYHTLMTPIAEAGRVGEFLRARGAGKSVVEAVYAAKEVGGNFSQIASKMKALNRMTLFLNPAIQAMDQAFYASGMHFARTPEVGRAIAAKRYFTKAFLSLSLPTIGFYIANYGDETVEEMQRTETGRRYWVTRMPFGTGQDGKPGYIVKIPKPQFEGQIFGTSVATAIDAWRERNPEEVRNWVQAMQNDMAVNLLPTAAVVPYSLVAGRDLGTGSDIVPPGKEQLDPAMWVKENTSSTARVIGQQLGPLSSNVHSDTFRRVLSPAGIDFIVRNVGGTLASEFLQGLTVATDYNAEGFLAPKEELPIIRGVLMDYPTRNTRSIQEFYDAAKIIDSKAKTMQQLSEEDPLQAVEYFNRNRREIMMADVYGEARKELTNLRQAIEDLRSMPAGAVSQETKRSMQKQMTLEMIRVAQVANTVARSMR